MSIRTGENQRGQSELFFGVKLKNHSERLPTKITSTDFSTRWIAQQNLAPLRWRHSGRECTQRAARQCHAPGRGEIQAGLSEPGCYAGAGTRRPRPCHAYPLRLAASLIHEEQQEAHHVRVDK